MNQSQYESQFNHREKSNYNGYQDFSLEVHMLAGMLVPVVLTNTLGGLVAKRSFTNLVQQMDTARTYPQVR
jgi:hypothetical protein